MKKLFAALLCALMAASLLACAAPAAVPAEDPVAAPAADPTAEIIGQPADAGAPVEMTVADPATTVALDELSMGMQSIDLVGLGQKCDVNIEYFQNGDEASDAIAVTINDGSEKDASYSIYPGYFNETCHIYVAPKTDGKTVIVIGYGLDKDFADTRTDFILFDGESIQVCTMVGLPQNYHDGTFTMQEGDEFTVDELQFAAPAAQ